MVFSPGGIRLADLQYRVADVLPRLDKVGELVLESHVHADARNRPFSGDEAGSVERFSPEAGRERFMGLKQFP